MRLKATPQFLRKSARLVKRRRPLKADIDEVLRALTIDPFDPALDTHKLKGPLRKFWACTVAYDLRIIFEIGNENGETVITLQTIGSHDDVYE